MVGLSFVGSSNSRSNGESFYRSRPECITSVIESPIQKKTEDTADMLRVSILGENYSKLCSFRDLKKGWNGYGGEEISMGVILKAMSLLMGVCFQPSVFPTGRGSIQIEYYREDDFFVEIEVFEDRISAYSENRAGTIEEDDVSKEKASQLLNMVYGE